VLFQLRILLARTPPDCFSPVIQTAGSFAIKAQDDVLYVILSEAKNLSYWALLDMSF
jgi:hypothetical protein